jgi:hypothetical protein
MLSCNELHCSSSVHLLRVVPAPCGREQAGASPCIASLESAFQARPASLGFALDHHLLPCSSSTMLPSLVLLALLPAVVTALAVPPPLHRRQDPSTPPDPTTSDPTTNSTEPALDPSDPCVALLVGAPTKGVDREYDYLLPSVEAAEVPVVKPSGVVVAFG